MQNPCLQLIKLSQIFDEKINSINSQFFAALDDFKKYYVYYNKNPEVNEFQNYYSSSKGQLQSLSANLFSTTNNIDKSIDDLNTSMEEVAVDLEKEKELNKKLSDILTNLENTKNGSQILIDDSKTEYNIQYYQNIEILIGVVIVGGLLVTMFKKKTT